MTKKQTVDIHLGYFKQGDDLFDCIEKTKTPQEALKLHADTLRSVADHLDKIVCVVGDKKIKLEVDCHFISLTCDEKLANELVGADLADTQEY
jgi:hypothetical protein